MLLLHSGTAISMSFKKANHHKQKVPVRSVPCRPDVRSVDAAGLPGVELERLVHPGALGLSLPDAWQHLLLAPGRLPVRPHLHPGHHHLPAAPAVCPRRGHCGESPVCI